MNKVTKIYQLDKKASIGKRIQYLRKNKGIKQEELAEKIGITRYILGKYEDDKTSVPAELLKKLANELDTSINYLLGQTESKSTNINEQEFSKITGLNDKSIEVLKMLKKFAPNIIDTINYLIEQEEIFPISDFSFAIPENETEEERINIEIKAEENYRKAEEYWKETHFGILSKITDFYDIMIEDKMIYIDRKNNIKEKEDFKTEFQANVNTREKIFLKDIINTKILKDIEYQLKKSKDNRQKDNTEKNRQLERYLKNCNAIKIKKERGEKK